MVSTEISWPLAIPVFCKAEGLRVSKRICEDFLTSLYSSKRDSRLLSSAKD
jgi:hypothetical protein